MDLLTKLLGTLALMSFGDRFSCSFSIDTRFTEKFCVNCRDKADSCYETITNEFLSNARGYVAHLMMELVQCNGLHCYISRLPLMNDLVQALSRLGDRTKFFTIRTSNGTLATSKGGRKTIIVELSNRNQGVPNLGRIQNFCEAQLRDVGSIRYVNNHLAFTNSLKKSCLLQYFTLPLLVQQTPMDFRRTLPFPTDSADSPLKVHRSPLDMTGFRC